MEMIRVFYLLIIAGALSACNRRAIPVRSQQTDSVRVERHTEYIERVRWDTAYIDVPAQSNVYTGPADSSHLETGFAISDARINPDGTLFHDLRNRPLKHPVSVPATDTEKTLIRDSIVYRDRRVEVPVRLPLTRWQKFLVWSGAAAWGILLLFISCKIIKR